MSWERFAQAEERLGVRRTAVLFCTLWMTWKAFDWAAQYAYVVMVKADNNLMVAAAGLVIAVTAPIAYLQKAVFESYISSKGSAEPPKG